MIPETEAFIKDRLLAGYTSAEIAKAYPRRATTTIGVYASKVRKSLTPTEMIEAEKAKNSRRYTRAIAVATRVSLSDAHWKIGARIARLRNEKFLSPGEFCKFFEFGTTGKISKMENGKHNFTLTELVDLSKILNISVGNLVEGSF